MSAQRSAHTVQLSSRSSQFRACKCNSVHCGHWNVPSSMKSFLIKTALTQLTHMEYLKYSLSAPNIIWWTYWWKISPQSCLGGSWVDTMDSVRSGPVGQTFQSDHLCWQNLLKNITNFLGEHLKFFEEFSISLKRTLIW